MTGWLLFSKSKQISMTKQLLAVKRENKIKKIFMNAKKLLSRANMKANDSLPQILCDMLILLSLNPQRKKNSKSIIYHVLFIIVGCKCFAHFSSSSSPHNNKYTSTQLPSSKNKKSLLLLQHNDDQ